MKILFIFLCVLMINILTVFIYINFPLLCINHKFVPFFRFTNWQIFLSYFFYVLITNILTVKNIWLVIFYVSIINICCMFFLLYQYLQIYVMCVFFIFRECYVFIIDKYMSHFFICLSINDKNFIQNCYKYLTHIFFYVWVINISPFYF